MTPDNELLRCYARTRSEEAFSELVRRHVNFVYSAALRQVGGDAHLAQDVAQMVFSDLARKAASLSSRDSLSGWLYTSAHFAAAKVARSEHRRRDREEKFMREPIHENRPAADWEQIRPALDEAMHLLKESDREAILLRYFENRPFAEIGVKFGLGENAARMRVERALEKLRGILARRGVTTTAAFSAVISANAVQTAPAGLGATLISASLAAAGTGTSLLTIMTATPLKLGVSALIAVAATALVMQHQAQEKLRGENNGLRRELAQLQSDNESLSNRLDAASHSKSSSKEQLDELLKLRAEAGNLRNQLADAARVERRASSPAGAADANDPATRQRKMAEFRVRGAKDLVATVAFGYAGDHKDQFPTNWQQAAGYFGQMERNGLNPGEVVPDTVADFSALTNEFDLVYQGSWHALTNWSDAIVVREKQAFQTSDGKWAKAYGFADGHSEIHVVPDGNFDAFEQQHTAGMAGQ